MKRYRVWIGCSLAAAVLLGWLVAARAQVSEWERMGFNFGPRPGKQTEAQKAVVRFQAKQAEEERVARALGNTNNYRLVGGVLYNAALSTNWVSLGIGREKRLTVENVRKGVLICREETLHQEYVRGVPLWERPSYWKDTGFLAITNHPKLSGAVQSQTVSARALRVGSVQYMGAPVALYDCGVPPGVSAAVSSPP